ncbi:MAG: putative dehydrogenase [Candidatus Latescibacterota bacterium]|jgi:predicted dehydrogenase
MLKLAIVGCGWAGSRHVGAIRELDEKVEVVCLVDNDEAFVKEKADEFGIPKVYTDYADVLKDVDVDAVDICTPHHLHCGQAVAAAEAGKHVLVEKPMARTVKEANRMMAAADQNGIRLYVAESAAYTPMAKFLREVVQAGKYIGNMVAASFAGGFRATNFGYPGRRAWLTLPQSGGTGTWMLHGIHSMAQVRYILGEVETVYMREHHAASFERPDLEGTMTGILTMVAGYQVSVLQTCEARLSGSLGGYTLHGDQGSLRATADGCHVFPADGEPFDVAYPESALSEYALELAAFADYVAGAYGPTDGASERRSLAVVQAGYESAMLGQSVVLRERFGML